MLTLLVYFCTSSSTELDEFLLGFLHFISFHISLRSTEFSSRHLCFVSSATDLKRTRFRPGFTKWSWTWSFFFLKNGNPTRHVLFFFTELLHRLLFCFFVSSVSFSAAVFSGTRSSGWLLCASLGHGTFPRSYRVLLLVFVPAFA